VFGGCGVSERDWEKQQKSGQEQQVAKKKNRTAHDITSIAIFIRR
jgi:hypothetical protein